VHCDDPLARLQRITLGQLVLPDAQARALAKRAELQALPIRGLPAMPLGWAARDFELLTTAAREFLSLFKPPAR